MAGLDGWRGWKGIGGLMEGMEVMEGMGDQEVEYGADEAAGTNRNVEVEPASEIEG